MHELRYVYTLRLIGPISYLDACYIHTKVTITFVRKFRCTIVGEPLTHIHQDTKSARLIAVCERSFNLSHSSWAKYTERKLKIIYSLCFVYNYFR